MVSSKKLLFYNTELDREKANLFMTPDNEWVIKSNVQKCWLNEKYFVYLMMQNTEQMKISKAQREKLWNLQMGFNFHRFYTKTFTIHPVQFYQMQLCLKCRALSQILIVSTFQTSALQEIPFLFFLRVRFYQAKQVNLSSSFPSYVWSMKSYSKVKAVQVLVEYNRNGCR